jgi:hypothetical protein
VQSGEIIESNEVAFSLRLPRGLRVMRRETDMIVAEGSVPLAETLAYIRRQADVSEEAEDRPGITSFKEVRPKKPANDWKGRMRIEASGTETFTSLRIFGQTFPKY